MILYAFFMWRITQESIKKQKLALLCSCYINEHYFADALVGNCTSGSGSKDNLVVREYWWRLCCSQICPARLQDLMDRKCTCSDRRSASRPLPFFLPTSYKSFWTRTQIYLWVSVYWATLTYILCEMFFPVSSPILLQNCHMVYLAYVSAHSFAFCSVILPYCLSPTMSCWIIFMPFLLR